MPKPPLLTNYPYLHNVLRNDAKANTDYNAIVSQLSQPLSSVEREQMQSAIDAERTLLAEVRTQLEKSTQLNIKAVRFIRLLGELMESQTELKPYVQDVSEKRTYSITFSADQVRFALRWYWDVLSAKMEDILRSKAMDPADESEE